MIEVEERIPQAAVWLATEQGGQKIATGDYFAGRKILLFGLPGAFTPTCSEIHLPGYIAKAKALRAAGVDAIACLAVRIEQSGSPVDEIGRRPGAGGETRRVQGGAVPVAQ